MDGVLARLALHHEGQQLPSELRRTLTRSPFQLASRRRIGLFITDDVGLLRGRHGGRAGEGTNEKDELPALLFGEAFFEGGHGLSAFGDLVKDFAVGDFAHARGVGEIGGRGIVHHGVGAIALAGIAVAVDALLGVDLFRRVDVGIGSGERIPARLFLGGNNPGSFVEGGKTNGEKNQGDGAGKEDFAHLEVALRVGGHSVGDLRTVRRR